MRATILLEVETDDTDLLLLSEDIKDALASSGIEVVNAKPWKREGLMQPNPFNTAPPSSLV